MLVSSAVNRGFEPRAGETKDYKIAFVASLLSTQHYLRRKSKDWLAPNQDNVSKWNGMSYPRNVVSVS